MWKCENVANSQFQWPIGKWLLVVATMATLATLITGCAVENLTVHDFRTMGMDQDSAAAAAAVIDAVR